MGARINWLIELHPMVVHFSVALLCFAFFLDVVAWVRTSQSARTAALYSLIGGAVATVLSVLTGLITPEAREREGQRFGELSTQSFSVQRFFSGRLVEVHKHWAYVLLALVAVWFVVRLAAQGRPARWQSIAMGLGALALIALILTGYYGGDLVYGRRGRERGQAAPVVQSFDASQRPVTVGGRPEYLERYRVDRRALHDARFK